MWIPDFNGSTINNIGPFSMNSIQGIKEVLICIPTVGKGEGVFYRNLFMKLVLPVTRSGKGSDTYKASLIIIEGD